MDENNDEFIKYKEFMAEVLLHSVNKEGIDKILNILEKDDYPIRFTKLIIRYEAGILLEYWRQNSTRIKAKNLDVKAHTLLMETLRFIEEQEEQLRNLKVIKDILFHIVYNQFKSKEVDTSSLKIWDA